MSVPVRSVASLLALLAISCAGSPAAQAAPEGRAWTDPPVRGSVLTPDSEAAKGAASPATSEPRAADAKPGASDSNRHAAASEPKAASTKRHAAAPKPRIAAVRPRPVATRSAPARPAVRARIAAPVRLRPSDPRMRYGFLPPPPPPGMLYVDPRARHIRQAEVAGYFVVRRSAFAAPGGRLVYGYRPDDVDDD